MTSFVTVSLGFLADSVRRPSLPLASPTPAVSMSSVWTWAQRTLAANRAGQVGGADRVGGASQVGGADQVGWGWPVGGAGSRDLFKQDVFFCFFFVFFFSNKPSINKIYCFSFEKINTLIHVGTFPSTLPAGVGGVCASLSPSPSVRPEPQSGDENTGVIIGAVTGGVVGAILLLLLLLLCCCWFCFCTGYCMRKKVEENEASMSCNPMYNISSNTAKCIRMRVWGSTRLKYSPLKFLYSCNHKEV